MAEEFVVWTWCYMSPKGPQLGKQPRQYIASHFCCSVGQFDCIAKLMHSWYGCIESLSSGSSLFSEIIRMRCGSALDDSGTQLYVLAICTYQITILKVGSAWLVSQVTYAYSFSLRRSSILAWELIAMA